MLIIQDLQIFQSQQFIKFQTELHLNYATQRNKKKNPLHLFQKIFQQIFSKEIRCILKISSLPLLVSFHFLLSFETQSNTPQRTLKKVKIIRVKFHTLIRS